MTSDINQVQNGINMTLRLLLRSPFVVFGAMVMAFTVDRKAATVFCSDDPSFVYRSIWDHAHQYAPVSGGTEKAGPGTDDHERNLMGIRVIRAFNRQESEKKAFEKGKW